MEPDYGKEIRNYQAVRTGDVVFVRDLAVSNKLINDSNLENDSGATVVRASEKQISIALSSDLDLPKRCYL